MFAEDVFGLYHGGREVPEVDRCPHGLVGCLFPNFACNFCIEFVGAYVSVGDVVEGFSDLVLGDLLVLEQALLLELGNDPLIG